MAQFSTTEQFILLLYNEATPSQQAETTEILKTDARAAREFAELKEAMRQLPKAKFNPSDDSVSRILRHSKRTAPLILG